MERSPIVGNRGRRLLGISVGMGVVVGGLVLIACTGSGEPGAQAGPLSSTVPAMPVGPAETCPAPTPVPPLSNPDTGQTCHPSACTPGFCARGDIAPLSGQAATQPLQSRLLTLDCSPH